MHVSPKKLARLFVDSVENASPEQLEQASAELVSWLHARGEMKKVRFVAQAIERVWKDKYGLSMLTITTAHPLTEPMQKAVHKLAFGADVRTQTDPSLIGGAKLRIDDRIIDGTLKGALEQLNASLSN